MQTNRKVGNISGVVKLQRCVSVVAAINDKPSGTQKLRVFVVVLMA